METDLSPAVALQTQRPQSWSQIMEDNLDRKWDCDNVRGGAIIRLGIVNGFGNYQVLCLQVICVGSEDSHAQVEF